MEYIIRHDGTTADDPKCVRLYFINSQAAALVLDFLLEMSNDQLCDILKLICALPNACRLKCRVTSTGYIVYDDIAFQGLNRF